jgi:hypothetical protein
MCVAPRNNAREHGAKCLWNVQKTVEPLSYVPILIPYVIAKVTKPRHIAQNQKHTAHTFERHC